MVLLVQNLIFETCVFRTQNRGTGEAPPTVGSGGPKNIPAVKLGQAATSLVAALVDGERRKAARAPRGQAITGLSRPFAVHPNSGERKGRRAVAIQATASGNQKLNVPAEHNRDVQLQFTCAEQLRAQLQAECQLLRQRFGS